MTQTITVTATQARQNLYQLIDQVAKNNAIIKINKKNLNHPVVIQRASTMSKKTTIDQLDIVRQTAGSLKTSGYKPNEMELAAKIFVKEYKEKNG